MNRSQWEHEMERCVASSEKMLQQIHAMVLALHPAPAAGSPPAALGSARVQVRRSGARFSGAASRDGAFCPGAAIAIWL